MAKKVIYHVHGSEDGTLGIFSNFKAAYECAADYMDEYVKSFSSKNPKCRLSATYSQAVKKKLSYQSIFLTDGDMRSFYIGKPGEKVLKTYLNDCGEMRVDITPHYLQSKFVSYE